MLIFFCQGKFQNGQKLLSSQYCVFLNELGIWRCVHTERLLGHIPIASPTTRKGKIGSCLVHMVESMIGLLLLVHSSSIPSSWFTRVALKFNLKSSYKNIHQNFIYTQHEAFNYELLYVASL